MAIENDPLLSGTIAGIDESLLDQIATSQELEAEVARVEQLAVGRVRMSMHGVWLGEDWTTMLFTSLHPAQVAGPLVSLTVNRQTYSAEAPCLAIEDFAAMTHELLVQRRTARLAAAEDTFYGWELSHTAPPILYINGVKVERIKGKDYHNNFYMSGGSVALEATKNISSAKRLREYLSLLNEATLLENVVEVSQRCV